jgi:hypothetical protein
MGELDPKRFGAAEKAIPDDSAKRRRRVGVSAPRLADAVRWVGPKAQPEENARSKVPMHRGKGGLRGLFGRGLRKSKMPRRCGSRPNPMRWAQGRGSKGKPEPMRFDAAVMAAPECRAERQTLTPKRSGVEGEAGAAKQPAEWSRPPENARFSALRRRGKGRFKGRARRKCSNGGSTPGTGDLPGSYCQPANP